MEQQTIDGNWAEYIFFANFEALKSWKKFGLPSEEVIQQGYEEYLEFVQVERMANLYEITEIKPKLSEDLIQEAYKEILKKNHHLGKAFTLEELVGVHINLPDESIQETYNNYALVGNYPQIELLMDLTKIKPKVNEETVQKGYNAAARKGIPGSILKLQEIFGIKSDFDEKDVQAGYVGLMQDMMFNDIAWLIELTGIKPSDDKIQWAYGKYFKACSPNSCKKLQYATQIPPDPKLVEEAIAEYKNNDWKNLAEDVKHKFGMF